MAPRLLSCRQSVGWSGRRGVVGVVGNRPVLARLSTGALSVHIRFFRAWEDLRWGRNIFQNRARREWWSVHVEAWRRSGLSQRRYYVQHRLDTKTFARWLMVVGDAKALQHKERRERPRPDKKLSKDKRAKAVQAFWAMHVEAMTWSGMSVRDYAAAHRASRYSLRRWRGLLETGEVEIDWRDTFIRVPALE